MKNIRPSADSARFSKHLGAAFLTGALAVTGLSACSLFGEKKVAKEDVENEISKLVKQEAGDYPHETECPDGLKAEEGAKLECKLHIDDSTFSVDVTANTVEDEEVQYDIKIADQPD